MGKQKKATAGGGWISSLFPPPPRLSHVMSTAGFADVLSTINGRILPSPLSMAPYLLFESFGFAFSKLDLKLLESFPPLAPLHRPSTTFRGSYASFSHAGRLPPLPVGRSAWCCLLLL